LPTTAAQIRLCVIGNPESIHVRRWAGHFAGRGFDVHIVSFYPPREQAPEGVKVDFLRPRRDVATGSGRARAASARWPGAIRLVTALRLTRAGFLRTVADLRPDIVHAHYVSDYGFLAALTRRHPLVVSAWGSDLLVDPGRSLITRNLVRWVLARAELVTYDAGQVAEAAERLGAARSRLLRVVLGVEDDFMRLASAATPPAQRAPLIVSLRSLERQLYNVELIVRAMPEVLRAQPAARLLIGNDGALRPQLEQIAAELGVSRSVEFIGFVQRPREMAELLGRAAVYVSVPSSDGTSVTLLEAMAAGAYPVASDLLSNGEWIDTTGGELVPVGSVPRLAAAIVRGVNDPGGRERAARRNLDVVRSWGLWEPNMARVEDAYRRLIGR
jgi:L-malate glycosyltransferase